MNNLVLWFLIMFVIGVSAGYKAGKTEAFEQDYYCKEVKELNVCKVYELKELKK